MRPRLLVTFLLIVIVPLGLLGWLGARVALQERETVQQRFQELLLGQLGEIRNSVARYLEAREVELLRAVDMATLDPADIRARIRDESLARQIFVLDGEGALIYPSPEGETSQSEREFLERTRELWVKKDIFYRSLNETPTQSPGGWITRGPQPPSRRNVGDPNYGWYAWYWTNGINLIFWRRNPAGWTVGVELDRTRLLSDIVGHLPETDMLNPDLPHGSIALVDSRGRPVYQWGTYEPPEGEQARASLPLEYPLQSWRLDYFASEDMMVTGVGKGTLLSLISSLTVVGIALVALAVYFYRESSRELREAAQRVTFVNQVSHELKTPLTSIRMYAELLENEITEEDEKPRRHLRVIVAESQRLSRLIGNILTFGRSRRKQLRLYMGSGVVDEVIGAVLERFRTALESKGVKVEFLGDAKREVQFDADAVEQILGNLFNNVEKYAASAGSMKVTSAQQGDTTTVTVSDRGPGIPENQREKIFRPFYRMSDRLADGVTGTGIGLSISRELARLHGGDLVLDPADEGATFRVTLSTPKADGGEGT